MVMMRAGGWTVEVFLHSDTPEGPVEQLVQVKDRGFVVYRGNDLTRARFEAELGGLWWGELEIIDDSGAAAAG